ncbi:hypothetical protein FOMPIDRAFT_8547, partial [Fomitopsis schrenkii]
IAAAIHAARITPRDAPLEFATATDHLGNVLVKHLAQWEDTAWEGVHGAEPIKTLINVLQQRCAPTTIRKIDPDDQRTRLPATLRKRDELIDNQSQQPVDLSRDPAFELTGARLSALTQAQAYRCIRERMPRTERPATRLNMDNILNQPRAPGAPTPKEDTVWMGAKHKDFQRKVADFIWKGIHNAHRIGHYWGKIPGYEAREKCAKCGTEETLEHILLDCSHPGAARVWDCARSLWEAKGLKWTKPNIAGILNLGAAANVILGPKPLTKAHHARLWRILISESAYIIWRLRCTRVIEHEGQDNWEHSEKAITTLWLTTLNKRVRQDAAGTSGNFGGLAPRKELASDTWADVIENEAS